jgi:hypothetical protein
MDFRPADDTLFPMRTQTYTGTAGVTATWDAAPGRVNCILVYCTTDACVKVGSGVTATTSSTPIPAYTPIILDIPNQNEGGTFRVSAIQISAGGSVYAKPGFSN